MVESPESHWEPSKGPDRETREARLAQVRTLLAANYADKEIAQALGIGLNRARKDVAFVREELGFNNRRDAARYLAEIKGVHVVPGPSRPLASTLPAQSFADPADEAGQANRVRDIRADYSVGRSSPDIGLPFRQRGSERAELNVWQRLAWIALIACVAFTTMGILSFGLQAIR